MSECSLLPCHGTKTNKLMPETAREILSRPEASRMGGEKREVVSLFSGVRGFTPCLKP